MKNISSIVWGIVLIVLGLIFGLNALEITKIDIFFEGWWTLFIIIPCFIGLIKDDDKTGNLIGLLIGIVLLLCCQSVLSFALAGKLIIPVALVLIGLSFIFKNTLNSALRKEISKLSKNTDKSYCATFGGQNLNLANEDFDGCELNAVFGGIKLDLVNANIKDNSVITASSIFGGITIYVPKDVKVKVMSTPIFGGVENKHENNDDKKNKTLYINATCVFGGVEIK